LRRDVEKMESVLENVLRKMGLRRRIEEYKVIEEWENIVGKVISEKVMPLGVERGRMVVQVQSSPWLMEMRMRKEEILKRIEERVGEGVIREIRFVQK